MDKSRELEIETELKGSMSAHRWQHSLGVAQLAKTLAVFWGTDPSKAWLAGILHDYARELPKDQLIKIAQDHGWLLLEEEKANPIVLHAPVGAFLARSHFGITDQEILSAITKHTVGGESMSLLDKIVFLADMVEPGREWPGVEKLRSLIYQDIDATLREALCGTMHFLREHGQVIHPLTLVLWNQIQLDASKI